MARGAAAIAMACIGPALAVGCGDHGGAGEPAGGSDGIAFPTPGDEAPGLVVGIKSDLPAGDTVVALVAHIDVGGVSQPEQRIALGPGAADFPLELAVPPAPNGTRFDVALAAIGASGETLLTRRTATIARDGRTLLLSVRLEDECTPQPAYATEETCDPSTTCIAGKCRPYFVPPETLADYHENWAAPFADACKPIAAGASEVELGQGREGFEEIAPLGPMLFEAGNQGGHHVWLATRTRNLHQDGALTFFEARADALGLELHPWTSTVEYEPAPLGCEMVGYLFRLYPTGDQVELDPATLDGELVHFDVTVLDSVGDAAHAELTVTLSAE